MSNLTTFGNGVNKSFFEDDGKLHFAGDARPVLFSIFTATDCQPSTHNQFNITSLAAANGITADGLDQAIASGRVVEIIGINDGVYTKGVVGASYSQEDTTHESQIIKIRLSTMYALNTWDQTSDWRLILDILSGDITGKFTIFMPPFSLLEYSTIEMYITDNGSTYYNRTSQGFDNSLSGSKAATENMVNNESAGSNVVIEVISTTGFYEGNHVLVSDSLNSEWSRITGIVTDTSITVDELANSYTTANSAKMEIIDYIKTVATLPLQRGLTKIKKFKANENSGLSFNYAKPHQVDDTTDLHITLQYVPTENNAGGNICKFRTQYVIYGVGEDIPQSIQYGTMVYADVTPPATKIQYIALLCAIPAAVHAGKRTFGIQIVRMGNDAGDTYTGNINFIAAVVSETTDKLGYEP